MKRIFTTLLLSLILLTQTCVLAKANKSDLPTIKFNKSKYELLYSSKNKETNSYINEYYKHNESYTNWTELLAVHHFKNSYSPIDQAKLLKEGLSSMGCPSAIDVNEKNNTATIDFIIINTKQIPVIIEFNVFKYEKDPICGTIALQYAKRYLLNDRLAIEKIKKSFAKSRVKYIKKVNKFEMPKLIEASVENGEYIKEIEQLKEEMSQPSKKTQDENKKYIKDTEQPKEETSQPSEKAPDENMNNETENTSGSSD